MAGKIAMNRAISAARIGRMRVQLKSGPGSATNTVIPGPDHCEGVAMGKRTCSIDGCDNGVLAREMCSGCYARWREANNPRRCSVEGCGRRFHANGLCKMHDRRMRNYGSTDDPRPTALDRFTALVDKTGEHWLWTGQLRNGYGRFRDGRKSVDAHRWAYEHYVGAIPEGLHIDHLCRTRECVNPEHLETVTPTENNRRAHVPDVVRGQITNVCRNGHEYTAENTRMYRGKRVCKQCARDSQRRFSNKGRKAS